MKSLYVIGTAGSGKTALCVALALKLKREGHKVAYFKPVGNVGSPTRREDEDAVLMKELLQSASSLDRIAPITTSPSYLARYDKDTDLLTRVRESFAIVAEGADVVVIEGTTTPEMMLTLGLDAVTLAKSLGSNVLTVSKVDDDYAIDRLLLVNAYVRASGVPLVGSVLNNVPKPLLDKCRGVYQPILAEHSSPVLGIMPARPEITAPSVHELYDMLGGELLAGEDRLDGIVEDIVIGAMTQESALTYFRRSVNKAVITGGDRADIALAALETSTSVLVLTGGLYPDVKVLARAEEKGVAVLLVPHDTYTTIEQLHAVTRKIKASDHKSIQIAVEALEANCDYPAIRAGVLS